jgi:hypothetical protein
MTFIDQSPLNEASEADVIFDDENFHCHVLVRPRV